MGTLAQKESKTRAETTDHSSRLLTVMVVLSLCGVCRGSEIHICGRPSWEKPEVMEGHGPVRMCCDASDWCKGGNSISVNDSLTLLPQGMSESSLGAFGEDNSQLFEMHRPDACHVELLVKNLTQDKLSLVCRLNGGAVARTDLEVIPKPPVPHILKVTSTPDKNITALFDRRSHGLLRADNYTVTMIEHLVPSRNKTRTVTLCSLQQTPTQISSGLECPEGERICTCRYNESHDLYDRVRNIDVTITVTVERILLEAETKQTLNLVNHIQPEAPVLSGLDLVSPHTVTVKVCLPTLSRGLNTFMRIHGSPVTYDVVLNKTDDGVPEVLTTKISADSNLPCVNLTFPNLAAYTRYSLTASLVAAEQGPSVDTEFVTHKTAPTRPPDLEKFAFTRSAGPSTLAVVWKPLPQTARGDADVTFDLEVWYGTELIVRESNISDNYWETSQTLPDEELVVRVWSRNEKGKSENFSSLDIPSLSDIKPVPFLVEMSKGKFRVHIKPEEKRVYRQMMVHICKTYVRYGDVEACTSYPQTLSLAPLSEGSDIHTFALGLEQDQIITTSTSLPYHFSERNAGVDEGLTNSKTASAVVETHIQKAPSWSGVESVMFFDSEEGDVIPQVEDNSGDGLNGQRSLEDLDDGPSTQGQHLSKRSIILDNIDMVSRTKLFSRDIQNTNWQREAERDGGVGQYKGRRRRLLSLLDGSHDLDLDNEATAVPLDLSSTAGGDAGIDKREEDEENVESYQVFVSVQAEDGRWLGMTPAQCYFSQSDNVRLIISQERDYDSDSLTIGWRQSCDRSPRQFLAESYQVSVSSDMLCKQNVSVVGEIVNSVFQPMKMQLPVGWPFFCIRAYRESSQMSDSQRFLSQPEVTSVEDAVMVSASNSQDRSFIIIASVVTAVVILIIIVVLFCVRCCRQGFVKISKTESQIQQMLDGVLEDSGQADLENPHTVELHHRWTSDQSGLATDTTTGDSGQGTLCSQKINVSHSHTSTRNTTQSGDSNSLSRYVIQGQQHLPKQPPRILREPIVGIDDTSSSDVDCRIRCVDDSAATSNGDDWLDSSAGDSGQSSNPRVVRSSDCGVRRVPIPKCTSDAADWLDLSEEEESCVSDIGATGQISVMV